MASPTRSTAPPALQWDKMIEQLSPECLREMGLKLSIDVSKNYRDLAGLLGFTADDVSQFALQDPTNPGHALLRRWGQRANSTARALKHHLSAIGRQDVIRMLDRGLSDPVDLVVVVRDEQDTIVYDGVIPSYGQETIGDALQSSDPLSSMFPDLQPCDSPTVFSRKAAAYKGVQLTLRRIISQEDSRQPTTPVQETAEYRDVHAPRSSPVRLDPRIQHTPSDSKEPPLRSHSPRLDIDLQASHITASIASETLPKTPSPNARSNVTPGYPDGSQSTGVSDLTDAMSMNLRFRSSPIPSNSGKAQATGIQRPYPGLQVTDAVRKANLYTPEKEITTANQPRLQTPHPVTGSTQTKAPAPLPKPSWTPRSGSSQAVTSAQRSDSEADTASGQQRPLPDNRRLDKSLVGPGDYLTMLQATASQTDYDETGPRPGQYETPRPAASISAVSQLPGYHEDATNNNIISNIFLPYTHDNNSYIVRPSRENPDLISISIIFQGEIINYRVHTTKRNSSGRTSTLYFLISRGPSFDSISKLVQYYKCHKIIEEGETDGPMLKRPL